MSKDLEGTLSIEQRGPRGPRRAPAFGGAGFVVGLFAPPLLAATAVGAVIGAGAGKLAHRKIESGIEEQAEETIPIGGAGLIVVYPPASVAGDRGGGDPGHQGRSTARRRARTRRR